MRLTHKQSLFIEEYFIDLNITQAALRAGYTKNSVHGIYVALNNSNSPLAKAVSLRFNERRQTIVLEQNRVLLEIARLALNDPRRAFDQSGALLPVNDWSDELAAAVASVKVYEVKAPDGSVIGQTKEIKFWDKGKNLELAARHLGLLHDKLEVTSPIAELIRSARERLRNS